MEKIMGLRALLAIIEALKKDMEQRNDRKE
jgi:hypothetical protein